MVVATITANNHPPPAGRSRARAKAAIEATDSTKTVTPPATSRLLKNQRQTGASSGRLSNR